MTAATLSSADLCAALDATYRRVDYAARALLGSTPGEGRHRRFTRDEAVRLAVWCALGDAGVSTPAGVILRAPLDQLLELRVFPVAITVNVPAIAARVDEAIAAGTGAHVVRDVAMAGRR